jgi:DNA modification methylase
MTTNNMTKKSESRLSYRPEQIEERIRELDQLMQEEVGQQFRIGDQLCVLIDQMKVKVKDLAVRFHRRRNRLSELHRTAKLFGSEVRDPAIAFSKYELARRAHTRFGCEPSDALKIVCRENLVRNRDVTKHFSQLKRLQEQQQVLQQSILRGLGKDDLINHCHRGDCLDLLPRLEDGSIKIAFCDLPYGQYMEFADGDYGPSVSRTGCDNATTEQVKALQEKLMDGLVPKMAPGGVLLLFRPGGILDPLHDHLVSCAKNSGWQIAHVLTWDKNYTKLGNRRAPYTTRTERIWVLKRQGEDLSNHDNSDRSDLLEFPLVRQRTAEGDRSHLMIKPMALCEFLIQKHSYEGELIFDACGCSGNFSIAAYRLNRKFIYCEVNPENFDFGSRRVDEAMARQKMSVG